MKQAIGTNGLALSMYLVREISNVVPCSLPHLSSLLYKVNVHSHDLILLCDPSDQASQLHVSLTRPIVLRKHEEDAFTEAVVHAVTTLRLSRYAASLIQFLYGLFSLCLPSQRYIRPCVSMHGTECWLARGAYSNLTSALRIDKGT